MMTTMRSQMYCLLALVGCFWVSIMPGWAQSFNTEFGKNRVQYSDDFKYWNVYETENFLTYFYGKARNVAIPTIQMAELYHDEIQSILEHKTNQKIQIIVYKNLADLKQSNVGLSDAFVSKTGETKIVGNRMFVYFDGDHQHLRRQIKEGIASVYLNSMLFGSTLQEIVQNAVLLDLPAWYKDGIVSYCARSWDYLLDDELRDILSQDPSRYYDFRNLSDDYPGIAGHSLWYYIDRNYGRSSIANLLYLTKITRDMESSFLYVLGVSYETVVREWSDYYLGYYEQEQGKTDDSAGEPPVDLKNKDYVPVSQMQIRPDGSAMVYAYNDIGKVKVVWRDLLTGEEETLWRYGYRNRLQATDYNYPVLSWHPRAPIVSIIYQDRDKIYLRRINLGKDEEEIQTIPGNINRVYGAISIDDDNYILIANTNGFSDLYLYNANTRSSTAISEDYYDDLDIAGGTYGGKKGFFWSSNRGSDLSFDKVSLDTILPTGDRDIYFYDLQGGEASRVTATPDKDERQPRQATSDILTYLHAGTGMRNLYAHQLTSGQVYPITNVDRNIILHEKHPSTDQHLMMYYYDGAYQIYQPRLDYTQRVNIYKSPFAQSRDTEPLILLETETDDLKDEDVIKSDYLFQTEYTDPPQLETIDIRGPEDDQEDPWQLPSYEDLAPVDDAVLAFNPARIVASRLRFRLDNFTTKFDNEVLFDGLESSIGDQNNINANPAGILIKGNVRDIFEDHEIEVGARFPTTFDGSEYFLVYDNNKKLIDHRYALYRRAFTGGIDDTVLPAVRTRKTSWLGLHRLRYPFDVYRSVRLTTTLRQDRFHLQSTDLATFQAPVTRENRIGVRAEYIFDNTLDVALNVKHGTRFKFYAEAINRFGLDVVDGFNFDGSLGFTSVFGFDARHYIPLLKHSVIALRATGATSLGSEQMLYYLGGVNNWVFQRFDESIPQPTDETFAFRTVAPHLRGFRFNIRNGSTFGLINVETRIPVTKYLSRRSVKNPFLRNLQLVLFYDAGMAWHGFNPVGPENPLNTVTITRPPAVEIEVEYFRDPLVMGLGWGVRSTMLGYYIKLDYAWGIETRRVLDPMVYFSIGTDF